MGKLETAIAVIIIAGGLWFLKEKFEKYENTISALKEELARVNRNAKLTESSLKWAEESYDRLLERYYKVLEKHSIPVNWEELENESKEEIDDTNSTLH